MKDGAITVLLVDDHAMVREGLASLLIRDPQICIVGQIGNGLEVVEAVRRLDPDVVTLNISLPGLNGLDICRELTKRFPRTAVLMLTVHDDEQFIVRALEYGASGYLTKEMAADQLVRAVRAVARGEVYLAPKIPKHILSRIGRDKDDPYERLTPRERQVFQLIAEGKTNREIAELLGVAVKTIDTHRSHLMRKLGIHDQAALVKYALRKDLIGLGGEPVNPDTVDYVGPVRVLLVSDRAAVCMWLTDLLMKVPDIHVAGQVLIGPEVMAAVRHISPDVIVLSVSTPEVDGPGFCQELRTKHPFAEILILGRRGDERSVVQWLEHGASGHLMRQTARSQLARAVRTVASGEVYIEPRIVMGDSPRKQWVEPDPYERLTPRERRLLFWIMEGYSNREISEILGISVESVVFHRTRMIRKLNLFDRIFPWVFATWKPRLPTRIDTDTPEPPKEEVADPSDGKTIRVLLVDDHVVFREKLAAALTEESQIEVVGQIGDCFRVAEEVKRFDPDVVLLGLTMSDISQLGMCRELRRTSPRSAILVLTTQTDEQHMAQLLKRGASGCLLKDAAVRQLAVAVRSVASGGIYMRPNISEDAPSQARPKEDRPPKKIAWMGHLVFLMTEQGKTDREIADLLHVEIKAVEAYRLQREQELDQAIGDSRPPRPPPRSDEAFTNSQEAKTQYPDDDGIVFACKTCRNTIHRAQSDVGISFACPACGNTNSTPGIANQTRATQRQLDLLISFRKKLRIWIIVFLSSIAASVALMTLMIVHETSGSGSVNPNMMMCSFLMFLCFPVPAMLVGGAVSCVMVTRACRYIGGKQSEGAWLLVLLVAAFPLFSIAVVYIYCRFWRCVTRLQKVGVRPPIPVSTPQAT